MTSTALVGTLVLGAGMSYAATTADLTEHGAAQREPGGDRTKELRAELTRGTAKNVILLIGDGMGDSEITVARNYAYGAAGELPGIDALPVTGQYTTYALDPSNGEPDYVTDSAASGTGWATGTKTYNGAISVDLDGGTERSLLEIAKANGLRTGNVSTSELQDATPAVQVAHVTGRKCYGPAATLTSCPTDALENGGLGSITEQLLDARPDVTLGGGATTFAETPAVGPWAGKTLLEQAEQRGYQVVRTADELAAATDANQEQPLLGLFADGNMPVRWVGPLATQDGGAEPAVECTENPDRPTSQPSLRDMTSTAIDLLDDPRSKEGFFLQVEGASIDKQDHAANPCGQIGETVDLDEATQVALDYAKEHGDTLVIVTADHAHSSQIVSAGSTTPGLTRTLLTADDQPMTVAYGTAEEGASQQHTGSQLRIAAYGPGAANVAGLTDQTDTFFTIRDTLRLDPDAPSPAAPQIRNVNVMDGAELRRNVTVKVTTDVTPKYTYIELNQDGRWITDNTKAPGSTQAGKKPTLKLDTRDYPDGRYQLKIDTVAIDGQTTEKLIDITIKNTR
ncbi:alkaline phosphatase [Cellulosimicrobium arenosum]|uniref:Alkaline phosphatase n=1 Tax=Cellulosimicrobium arenosum TaxID=2708133 RepID=A0A927IZH0_9MICO|nr:alkaline phosphatase [Cellulosimicrobium arenosum]MBD8078549.1 alkaline phosphatase [Cellulosimicrobium arenosum]